MRRLQGGGRQRSFDLEPTATARVRTVGRDYRRFHDSREQLLLAPQGIGHGLTATNETRSCESFEVSSCDYCIPAGLLVAI